MGRKRRRLFSPKNQDLPCNRFYKNNTIEAVEEPTIVTPIILESKTTKPEPTPHIVPEEIKKEVVIEKVVEKPKTTRKKRTTTRKKTTTTRKRATTTKRTTKKEKSLSSKLD